MWLALQAQHKLSTIFMMLVGAYLGSAVPFLDLLLRITVVVQRRRGFGSKRERGYPHFEKQGRSP